jgi:2-oxoglutarate ferredoxin oxidoreductase subunit alpha
LNNEARHIAQECDDADIIIVAFGTAGRVSQTAVKRLREAGLPAGLFRPITLWPFPNDQLMKFAKNARGILVVEMNAGQMVHDVREIVGNRLPIRFYGRMGGSIPMPDEIVKEVTTLYKQIMSHRLEKSNGHTN